MPEKSAFSNSWQQAPLKLALPVDRVDVWRVQLDESADVIPEARILSLNELVRASRFRFKRDRLRFVRCRSVLRLLLGRYLQTPASEIRFAYQRSGKPELATEQNRLGLRFNVSHSTEIALLAFVVGHRLGVDVEKIRVDVDIAALAEQFFSARERAGLGALPEELQLPAFFACWTRKESFIKATGDGLSLPLSEFSVTTHPDLEPHLEELRGNVEARRQWFLADLSVHQGYRAALTVEGATFAIERFLLELPSFADDRIGTWRVTSMFRWAGGKNEA
jgi:4'-phosphopantetheinyl transferase